MPITTNSSYHVALVFYPWANSYPLENKSNAKGNLENSDPIIYASGGNTISGITSIQYSRRKGVGGSMGIEFSGYIRAEDQLTLGTWCFLATSHVAPITTMKDIKSRGLIRFVGQVYDISAQYQVDPESGRYVRRVSMMIREWCHALHCPLRYHPIAAEANLSAVQAGVVLSKKQETDQKRSELIDKLGSSVTNVFQQPALALAWAGGLTKSASTSVLSAFNIQAEDLALFSTVIARLPVIPKKLLSDLGFDSSVAPDTAWSDGFLELLSGVQEWGSGSKQFFGKNLKTDEKAQRPVSPTPLSFVMSGNSLYSMVSEMVAGGGGTEVFADLWYEKKEDSWLPRPVFVVRDMPFTLKSADESLGGSKFPWTKYDDLPSLPIPAERVTQVSLKQGLHNTANLIQMSVAESDWAKVAAAQAVRYFGTTVLAESQKRFGAQTRPNLTIRDIFIAEEKKTTGKSTEVAATDKASSEIKKLEFKVNTSSTQDGYTWFSELSRKQIQWFGSDYLFPSCTITLKDANYPLAAGINISLVMPNKSEYVGHCDGFSQAFMVDSSGRITNTTTVQLSRLCIKYKEKLMPMSYRSIVNFLNQGTALDPSDVYDKTIESSTFSNTNSVDTESARALIKTNSDAIEKGVEAGKNNQIKATATVVDPSKAEGTKKATKNLQDKQEKKGKK
jgi:hypothetical protein